jgi:hypothetical protein
MSNPIIDLIERLPVEMMTKRSFLDYRFCVICATAHSM